MLSFLDSQPRGLYINPESNQVQYAVFSSYYKQGQVDLQIYLGSQMRAACIEALLSYAGDDQVVDTDMYEIMDLHDLIDEALEKGQEQINRQLGWGWRYVVSGSNLIEL